MTHLVDQLECPSCGGNLLRNPSCCTPPPSGGAMPFTLIRQIHVAAVFNAGVLIGNAVLLWHLVTLMHGLALTCAR